MRSSTDFDVVMFPQKLLLLFGSLIFHNPVWFLYPLTITSLFFTICNDDLINMASHPSSHICDMVISGSMVKSCNMWTFFASSDSCGIPNVVSCVDTICVPSGIVTKIGSCVSLIFLKACGPPTCAVHPVSAIDYMLLKWAL